MKNGPGPIPVLAHKHQYYDVSTNYAKSHYIWVMDDSSCVLVYP